MTFMIGDGSPGQQNCDVTMDCEGDRPGLISTSHHDRALTPEIVKHCIDVISTSKIGSTIRWEQIVVPTWRTLYPWLTAANLAYLKNLYRNRTANARRQARLGETSTLLPNTGPHLQSSEDLHNQPSQECALQTHAERQELDGDEQMLDDLTADAVATNTPDECPPIQSSDEKDANVLENQQQPVKCPNENLVTARDSLSTAQPAERDKSLMKSKTHTWGCEIYRLVPRLDQKTAAAQHSSNHICRDGRKE